MIGALRRLGSIAPRSFSSLSTAPNPSSPPNPLGRTNRSAQNGIRDRDANFFANKEAWLYRRFKKRRRCSGTGAITSTPVRSGRTAWWSHCAAGNAMSVRSPCLKARTKLRPAPRYKIADRPRTHGGGSDRQASHTTRHSEASVVTGRPQLSHTAPPRNVVSAQHAEHRPKSLSTMWPQATHRGGNNRCMAV